MFKYYRVIATHNTETTAECLYGSYIKADAQYELEEGKAGWKDEGYKGIKLIVERVEAAPDATVYTPEELAQSSVDQDDFDHDLKLAEVEDKYNDGDFSYNTAEGPTNDDDTSSEQHKFFCELKLYNITGELEHLTDFFLIATIGGIQYYTPNDENWGSIIAVDYVNRLAIRTGFYELDDIAAEHCEYRIVLDVDVLKSAFEVYTDCSKLGA